MKKIIVLLSFIGVILTIHLSGILDLISFETLQAKKEFLFNYVQQNYMLSVLIFIFSYFVIITFSIPGGLIFSLAGGFLFGTIVGTIFINISASSGAVCSFLLSKYIAGNYIQNRYAKQLESFNKEIKENAHIYLLTLRLMPIFPFFLINLMSGLTNVRIFTFFWTTSIGIIPGSLVFTFAGNSLGNINSISDIFSKEIFLVFTFLALFALTPILYKKFKKR